MIVAKRWLVAACAAATWVAVTAPQSIAAADGVVRLALVNVPEDILGPLLPAYQAQSGRKAEIVYTGNDPFSAGREGKADLVIAHYGHEGVEPFVTGGYGLWPRAVFANQVAVLGPPGDPAGIRGMRDAGEALRRIAETRSRFLSINTDGGRYLEQVIWASANMKPSGDWYIDAKSRGPQAAREAAAAGAYVIWGVPPFVRLKARERLNLEPMVVADPVLQRMMVAIAVNPKRVQGADAAAAESFVSFLLSPAVQARIKAFRYPNIDQQVWWPAGRHNQAQE